MRISFFGDIMLSGDQTGKPIWISKKLTKLINSFDVRVATLETAIGAYEDIDEIKQPKSEVAVWSKPCDLHKLLDLNVNVVSLANNHSCDCGVGSMLKLKDTLRGMGIIPIGAGRNLGEAMEPAVFDIDGESLAVIACCEDNPDSLGTLHFATDTKGGIYRLEESFLISHVRKLKSIYTYVAVVVHWGIEHKWLPECSDVTIAQELINVGADMVIGGHPHHIQPQVCYKDKPVFYSLGNLYFPDFCLDETSNVYYPSLETFDQLPVFEWMAPDRRNFAMRYFWKYFGRLSMMAMVSTCKGSVTYDKKFTYYHAGKLSISNREAFHTIILSLFAPFIGKQSSKRINMRISWIRHIIEHRLLALFCRKYQFFKYMENHNS